MNTTHFRCGHPRTEENSYFVPARKVFWHVVGPYYRCRACKLASNFDYRKARPAQKSEKQRTRSGSGIIAPPSYRHQLMREALGKS